MKLIAEFRINGKPWVVIPPQIKTWYPSLVDHACIIVGIAMCEEWKYPQVEGKQGYRYPLDFYNECVKTIVEEYMLTETGRIIEPKTWNIEEIYQKVKSLYVERFDPNFNTKSLKVSYLK